MINRCSWSVYRIQPCEKLIAGIATINVIKIIFRLRIITLQTNSD